MSGTISTLLSSMVSEPYLTDSFFLRRSTIFVGTVRRTRPIALTGMVTSFPTRTVPDGLKSVTSNRSRMSFMQ